MTRLADDQADHAGCDGPPQTAAGGNASSSGLGGIFTAIVADSLALTGRAGVPVAVRHPLLPRRARASTVTRTRRTWCWWRAAVRWSATGLAHLPLVAVLWPMTFFSWYRRPDHAAAGADPFSDVGPDLAEDRYCCGRPCDRRRYRPPTNGVAAWSVRQRRGAAPDDYNEQVPVRPVAATQGGYDQGGGGWSQNQWGPSGGRSRGPGGDRRPSGPGGPYDDQVEGTT